MDVPPNYAGLERSSDPGVALVIIVSVTVLINAQAKASYLTVDLVFRQYLVKYWSAVTVVKGSLGLGRPDCGDTAIPKNP